ncbi:MAG: hypothetical protein H6Q74_1147 [Firmicutes bacterium]|nr:hypothetical protein [Bacillota bacterium]
MRKIIIQDNLLIMVLIMTVLVMLKFPIRPQSLVYPLVRYTAQVKMNLATRSMNVYETEHFIIKYDQEDADVVSMVGQAAEDAYQPVISELDSTLNRKTLLIIYPDKEKMNKLFGWSGTQNAMGVYWGGVIQILSPKVWLHELSAEEFIHSGPMVHEFTHLVFDHITSGNYPRWFTEGLAQYVEYKVNGYEWRTADNIIKDNMYNMNELDDHFDQLDNQALAYRESLLAVRYIAQVHGEDKLHKVIDKLRHGYSMKKAIKIALGLNYMEFEAGWQQWARENDQH